MVIMTTIKQRRKSTKATAQLTYNARMFFLLCSLVFKYTGSRSCMFNFVYASLCKCTLCFIAQIHFILQTRIAAFFLSLIVWPDYSTIPVWWSYSEIFFVYGKFVFKLCNICALLILIWNPVISNCLGKDLSLQVRNFYAINYWL